MLQQINHNITDSEMIKDNFGLLPWSFIPSFWGKLIGQKSFNIDSNFLVINDNNIEDKVNYNDIESVECNKYLINIKLKDNKAYVLKVGKTSIEIANLILRLAKENNEFQSFMKVEKIVPELGFAYFLKSFNYRSDKYVRAVEILLKTAVDNNFSDIHFEPFENTVKLSYRYSGKLKYCIELNKDNYTHFLARAKYLAGCNNQVNNIAQEGAFRFGKTDIRLSTFPTDFGERTSLRFIGAVEFKTVNSLGWGKNIADEWLRLIRNNVGLFLITGSVSSGKTTAMYATLSELVNSGNGQIRAVTIEDPVEAFIEGICQSSFDSKTEKDLASAFKHLLRQDPDVIALGEIRDVESISEALQAGLSGHLVFATFHAGSPEEALERIKIMADKNKLILSGLKAILHLKLNYDNNKVIQIPQIKIMDIINEK